jgi:hypothetical protein
MSSLILWISKLLLTLAFGLVFLHTANAGTLSCSVTTAAACTGTVIWRMSGATNAHAELPSQATAAYDSNVVCCSGVTGLGTSCAGTFATALKLSGLTNAHSEQNSQANYANNACISVPAGGSVSIGYQATDCTGFDTTLGSMTGTTNAHVGNTTAYTTRICGTAAGAAAQTLTFSISDITIGFGTLSTTAARFATGDTLGSATEVSAHTLDVSTNAASGYIITVDGNTLTSGANTITAIGATAVDVTTGNGTKQFGIRLTVSGVGGSVTAPYNGAANNYALDTVAFPDQISSGSGDGTTDTYSVFYAANISNATEAGSYSATLTYIATGTF